MSLSPKGSGASAFRDGAARYSVLWLHCGCAALVALASLLVYYRCIDFGYVGIDDVEYVVHTGPVRQGLTPEGIAWALTSFRFSNWHPLTWMSYMLDVSLFGEAPGPKHAVNLLLHVCNSLLVYALAFRVMAGARHEAALLVALFFAVHPLHVESVAWVAERKDVLCALFYFAALHFHLDLQARPTVARYLRLQLACALALMSKPMAVTLPVALLLLDYWPGARLRASAGAGARVRNLCGLLLEKTPVILMSAVVCVLTVMAQRDAMSTTASVWVAFRLQNAVLSWVTYLRQMLLPLGLSPLYPLRPIDLVGQFLPAFAVLAGVVGLVSWRRRRAPWWFVGVFWFLLTLLPVIGLLQVGVQAHADRYMYIPSLGLLLAAGVSLSLSRGQWRPRAYALALILLVFQAGIAWIQVGYWSNTFMAYTRILDVTPDSWEGHVGLAAFHAEANDLEQSEFHARAALAIDSSNAFVHASLGNLLLARRDFPGAEASFRQALQINPRWTLAMNNLAVVLERSGRAAEAIDWYCNALAQDSALDGVKESVQRLRVLLGGGSGCDGR